MLNQQVFILVHIFVSNVAASFAALFFFFCITLAWHSGGFQKSLIMKKLIMKHMEHVLYCLL